ncbi:MAG: phenylalanine--tRNA ligase subunit beta [Elusimicrobia bacterium]|nr:phenylalanine--tRNA ligase subunit beta [Elusimicrobiota bacterium]
MKISLNWLGEHLDHGLDAAALCVLLARLGFEVAGRERRGAAFRGVVVGKVLSRDKHPNADKLSVCVVDDGTARWNVVCGAPNVAAGQAVAFARLGAELPGGLKIGKAKLRGVESQGMICSREELGLAKDGEGIWVLDAATAPGRDVASLLGPADDVLDVEIAPNRPDALSHRGLARELAAALGKPLKPLPAAALAAASGAAFPVSVEDAAACPYYSARLIEGVKVGPSPAWLKSRLEAIGLKPINNVVDATNFVLHDVGQPLHAFDADKLAGNRIVVRRAKAGETLLALDHKIYPLAGCLTIADADKSVALAGVMGGEASAVGEKTARILLEGACFAPAEVRRSSQRTRLRSESSYRFERGVDPELAAAASARAAALILQIAGGKAAQACEAAAPGERRPPIQTSAARINAILGTSFSEAEIAGALRPLAAELKAAGGSLEFRAPSWRRDLANAWNLAEEAGRFLGYDRVPYRLAPLAPRAASLTPAECASRRIRARLAALGLCEAYNYDLLSEKALAAARLPSENLPRVANPISEDWAVLRPSLLPGLLRNAQHNLSRGAESVRLFELGKVYARKNGAVEELWRVAGLLLGPAMQARWQPGRAPDAEFADAKAVVEDLLSRAGALSWAGLDAPAAGKTASDPLFHPANSLRALAGATPLATLGWLHPRVARAHDLERAGVVVFDLDLEALAALTRPRVQARSLSPFPPVRRDLALVVREEVPYGDVERLILGAAGEILQAVELFDVYRGKGVEPGGKSFAVRLTFGRADRTLTDVEVGETVNSRVLPALIRSGARPRC